MEILRNSKDTEQRGYYGSGDDGYAWDLDRPFITDVIAGGNDIDYLGHVSHAVYLSWVGKVTWAHNNYLSLTWPVYEASNAAMAIIRHQAEYALPVRQGEKLKVATWCTNFDERYQLERRYQIIRCSDGKSVFSCVTDYACIDIKKGRPRRMPKPFLEAYQEYFSGDKSLDENSVVSELKVTML